MDAAGWRAAMREWVLPDAVLRAAPVSPWGFPAEPFRTRAERATPGALTFANRRARDALPAGGTVLDVGVGAGAASLPLAPRCSLITGVDASREMLAEFQHQAERVNVIVQTINGNWPDVSEHTPIADVVVCNHVAYNVGDLAPFALALSAHARHGVVMEITSRHPTAWMADLWWEFHKLPRPVHPDAKDAVSVLRGLGLPVRRHAAIAPRGAGGFECREDAVAAIRRRLCLDAARDADVATALGDRLVFEDGLWSTKAPIEPMVTLWWDVAPEIAE
jgi:SAM-dependent methyltransferase